MRVLKPHSSASDGTRARRFRTGAWAVAGLLTAVVLIGASLTTLGRDVLGFGGWQSYGDEPALSVSAPAAPPTTRSTPSPSGRDGSGSVSAGGAAVLAGPVASAPASGADGSTSGGSRSTGDGTPGRRITDGADRSGTGSGNASTTPLTARDDAASAASGATITDSSGPVVQVDVEGKTYDLSAGDQLEVRTADKNPSLTITTKPEAPATTPSREGGTNPR